jgi:hypothetical protein
MCYLISCLYIVQNMRSKRENVASGSMGVHNTNKKSTGKSKNVENLGESFVRHITRIKPADSQSNSTKYNDPFVDYKWTDTKRNTTTNGIETHDMENHSVGDLFESGVENTSLGPYTKFHLEDDEMLMELMMHLHSDCPDMMANKQQLLKHVSNMFDQITMPNDTTLV